MENFLELCQKRQSCRDFTDQLIEHEKLLQCIEAARLAPSGCNAQPWSFVVVEDQKIVSEVAKATQQMGLNEFTSKAKAFIIVLEEHAVLISKIRCLLDSQYFAAGDVGRATLSICLAAEAQGLGSCMLGVFDRPLLSQLLDIPIEKRFHTVIALGYPASGKVRPKIRKPLPEIARFV